jgi:uncharacterized iron-regulated membrane protein
MITTKQRLRHLWFTVHKWLGLALGLPVLLIFLSGAVLVWKGSVDSLLNPQRQAAFAAAGNPSFYVAAANRIVTPAEHIASLTYPSGKGPVVVSTVPGAASAPMQGRVRYFLDPVTGALLDRASIDARPLLVLHVLHGSLLLGRPGGRLVGLVAIMLLASAFSGLWLWWPLKGAPIRGFRWRRTRSVNANLHHQAGYLAALPLAVLCVTGATISFPGLFAALVGDKAATRAEFVRNSAPPLSRMRSSLAQVLTAAGSPSPNAIEAIIWPTTADPRWKVLLDEQAGPMSFTVDDATGRASRETTNPPESKSRLMRRVHDGTGMPFMWQVIIFVTGLLGPILAVTGLIMWLRGEVRERRMRRQRIATSDPGANTIRP